MRSWNFKNKKTETKSNKLTRNKIHLITRNIGINYLGIMKLCAVTMLINNSALRCGKKFLMNVTYSTGISIINTC